jgi:membrane protease YdiL (CAAX protease family)
MNNNAVDQVGVIAMIDGVKELQPVKTAPLDASRIVDDVWRWVELAVGFVGVPVAVGLLVKPVWWIPCLWLMAGIATWRLQYLTGVRPHGFWAPIDWRRAAPELRRMGGRFAVSAVALLAAIAIWAPERLLDFPRTRPGLWITLLALYPVLSVYPQEVLYRRYLFHRLNALFGRNAPAVAASAVAFGAMHVIFRNEIAVIMTLIGGWFFADTYRRTGSLRLVCLEHALYGNLIFTIGLGQFIFHGAVKV